MAPIYTDMKDPKVGSNWTWNSPDYPMIQNVPVEVIESNDTSVIVEVTDEEFLQSRVRAAEKTYRSNGRDMDNVLEVCPLVKWDGNVGEFVPWRKHLILQTTSDRFANQFEKA